MRLSEEICRLCYQNLNWFTKGICKFFFNLDIQKSVKIPTSSKFGHCGQGCIIANGVTIGENVRIYPNVLIGNNYWKNGSATIKDNVTICSGATIVGEITIGENTIIGANSYIDKDVPSNSIVHPQVKNIISSQSRDSEVEE